MGQNCIAKVAIDDIVYDIDKLYNYIVPSEYTPKIKRGCRVMVPFGNSSKMRQAIVFDSEYSNESSGLKNIFSVVDEEPIIPEEMLSLAFYMKKKYYCTFFDTVKCMIPPGANVNETYLYTLNHDFENLNYNLNETENMVVEYLKKSRKDVSLHNIFKYCGLAAGESVNSMVGAGIINKVNNISSKIKDVRVKTVKMKKEIVSPNLKLTEKQKKVIDVLLSSENGLSIKEINYMCGTSTAVVESLIKKGIIDSFECTVYRDPYKGMIFGDQKDVTLTKEQQKAYESIYSQYKKSDYAVSLLYGITGSGKTSVFMKLIEDVHKEGKSVIIMVPEIALTPQMVSLFKSRFKEKVAVIHSCLSAGERLDEFNRIRNKIANIVVGTRSAVFAPVKNIGLIIMDEEQEYTYKSDSCPRYHARDIAKFRCKYHNGLLLLASATPSIESYCMAKEGKYSLNTLNIRYGDAKLPEVTVVDMNEETKKGNYSVFSDYLTEEIRKNINKKEQTILLLNRRGYNTFVSCRGCGEVVVCPNCSVSMTYHSANGMLMCHYCGKSINITGECPSCHKKEMKYMGVGTQKVEEELNKLFPECNVLRMDTDTTTAKYSYEKKLNEFASGKYNIMLGTQMVAKGLDFSNVTLAGVLSIDQTLYNEDFRSYERAFSLLTQVVGRSGRSNKGGRAIIQTFTPENPVIKFAERQLYDPFFDSEIEIRKAMLYPPFANICVVVFSGIKEERVCSASKDFFCLLKKFSSDYMNMPLRVLGPSPAKVLKVNNKYRYKIIVKYKNDKIFEKFMANTINQFKKIKTHNGTSVYIDMNPDMII